MSTGKIIPSLRRAKRLYLLSRQTQDEVLAPGTAGVPTPVASDDGILVRMTYISAGSDVSTKIAELDVRLDLENCGLLFLFESSDGVPFRTGRCFVFHGREIISWHDGPYTRHSQEVVRYSSPGPRSGQEWDTDALAGRHGWILTGRRNQAALWRVARYEVDAFGCSLFTLSPVESAVGLPAVDFLSVTDSLRRRELREQYEELQTSVVRHAFRDVVTKARNIIEGVLAWTLVERGEEPGRDLYEHLTRIKALIEKRDAPISDLSYHLAHKIRLLHARTHLQRVAVEGRSTSPEMALTVLEDLKEILVDVGVIGSGPR